MSPRAPHLEPFDKRALQRMRKQDLRRKKGLPEPSQVAVYTSLLLSAYRSGQGLSQQELGEILGMKQPQVARLESGFVTPSLATLQLISERLEMGFTIEVKSGSVSVRATRPESRPV
jgi:ribosome-binding protein aMBF1 (putative translation factor)